VEIVLYKILFVLLYFVLGAVLLTTVVGIAGNWILVGVAVVVALVTRFQAMTVWLLALCVGLAVVGEIVEAALGAVIIARRGGGRWGIIGSIVGGFAGVILGAGMAPPFGSVILGFVGVFLGAVLGEYFKQRRMEPAVRIGFWSFVGRMGAIAAKLAVGCGILWVIVATTWPQ
jgi:uncharacterized protein YqgC (DUF456 family)